jgi:hypothetical protein
MPPKEITPLAVKTSIAKKFFNKKFFFRVIITVVFLLAVGAACYFYTQTVALRKTTQQTADQELKDTVAKISRLILLPEGETPTMASVSDPAQLKNQPFFVNSQKGDQVLIYSKAKEAVLYRPSTNMIINFAPVNVNASEANANTPVVPDAPAAKKP